MKREDIKEYLDCNGFEALTSSDGTKYYNEEVVINIALEVVSHWISYSKEELEKILTEAVKKIEREKGNEIQIRVDERK
jgi:glutathionylspermidine synthase